MNRTTSCLLHVSAWSVALLTIVGCGGSSGGSSSGGTGNTSNPTTVTYTFTGGSPTVVAAKTGTGPYTAVAVTGMQASFAVPVGTTDFAIAYVCPPYQTSSPTTPITVQEYVDFESTLDATSFTRECPIANSTPKLGLLTGSVDSSAFPAASALSMGFRWGDSAAGTYIYSGLPINGSFQRDGPIGSDRVLMLLYNASNIAIAAKSFNNQTVPGVLNGGNPAVFGSADATVSRSITYANVPSGFGTPSAHVSVDDMELANGALTQYPELPVGVVQSSDYYTIHTSSDLNSASVHSSVGVNTFPTGGGAVTFTFPAAWTTVEPAPAALPTLAFDYTGFTGKSNILRSAILFWKPSGSINTNSIFVQSWIGNKTSLTIPDLSGVANFLAPPSSGTSVLWSKGVGQGNFPSTTTAANGTSTYVATSGEYIVP